MGIGSLSLGEGWGEALNIYHHEKGNLDIYLAATLVDSHGSWHHAWRYLMYVTKMKNEE